MYLARVREKKPLIHHITNYVVANETANLTLALGALPVMSHSKNEVEEMVSMAGALLLNIGTLDTNQVEAMVLAGKKANELSKPVIFDPVGVGATQFRNEAAKRILNEVKVSIIRGNYGEVATLAGFKAQVSGVESLGVEGDIVEAVKKLAREYGCVVCATGKEDIISDGTKVALVSNGHAFLSSVTGTGCMASTVNAIFAAVSDDYFDASVYAQAAFGIIGEIAFEKSGENPGSFHSAIYDAAYNLNDETIELRKKIEWK